MQPKQKQHPRSTNAGNRNSQHNQVSVLPNKHTYFCSPCASSSSNHNETGRACCDLIFGRETNLELAEEDDDLLDDDETVLENSAHKMFDHLPERENKKLTHSTDLDATNEYNIGDFNVQQLMETFAPKSTDDCNNGEANFQHFLENPGTNSWLNNRHNDGSPFICDNGNTNNQDSLESSQALLDGGYFSAFSDTR